MVKGDRLKFCCVCFASSNLAASIFISKNSNTFQYKLKNRYPTHLRITIFSRFSKKKIKSMVCVYMKGSVCVCVCCVMKISRLARQIDRYNESTGNVSGALILINTN